MKSFDTELKKYADKVNLKVSERRELRERILSYMEYHPLKKQGAGSTDLQMMLKGESFVTFHFNMFHARIAGGVLILMLIVAPFLAEKSMPGDALYFVKTGFTEPIQGKFANSPYEKIEFETKLMERRIGEARALASEGTLTEEVKLQLAETVKVHTKAVQEGLNELRTQDADGAVIAGIAFNSSLEVQSAVLVAETDSQDAGFVETILNVVNDAREGVATANEGGTPSYEGLIARVELETTRAYELFENVKKTATADEIKDIERRLSDVNRLTKEAKEKKANENATPTNDLANTLGLMQKLIVFMTDIDVRESVALETIVPVVLSEEERVSIAQNSVIELRELYTKVTERLLTIGDEGVKEKVADGLVQTETLLASIDEALTGNINIGVAETLLVEARAIMSDLDMVTQHSGIGIVEEETDEAVPTSYEISSSTPETVSLESKDKKKESKVNDRNVTIPEGTNS